VKLLTHPFDHSYQSHIATLSFFPRVYAPMPPISQDSAVTSKEKEWKRRIKLYGELLGTFSFSPSPLHPLIDLVSSAGPAVEMLGLERIVLARRRLLFIEHS
jgi:hypothetical protein